MRLPLLIISSPSYPFWKRSWIEPGSSPTFSAGGGGKQPYNVVVEQAKCGSLIA